MGRAIRCDRCGEFEEAPGGVPDVRQNLVGTEAPRQMRLCSGCRESFKDWLGGDN